MDANFCGSCGMLAAGGERTVLDELIDEFRRALDREPRDVSTRYNLALCYLRIGRDDLALVELERVRAAVPDFADAYYQLARIHERRGERHLAEDLITAALALEPHHGEAQRLREGLCLLSAIESAPQLGL
jgi:tetratricopeptide (TPR) repeat protein